MWFERSGFGKGFIVGLINVRDDFGHGGKGFQRNFAVNVHRFQNLYQIGVPMDLNSLKTGMTAVVDGFSGQVIFEPEEDVQKETEKRMQEEAEKQKMSIRDLVNMAALVEMEAVFKEEQPRIAGVFLRRLEIYMPIQSDTTIQYILGTQKEEITIADTRIQNPYNTYQNPGLPPGPISSPGMSAIKAVLNPEKTEYLYFVAEKDGHHRFTKTYAEHLKAIEDIHGPQ